MDSESDNEEAIFDAAIQIDDAAARSAYLKQVCGDNSTLRAAVDELLRYHDTKDDLFAKPVVDRDRTDRGDVEQPGSMLGRYRIVEIIGEGGFGTVYHAVQHEPVRRHVAIKILKPGMDTREIVRRFEAERQSLAMMAHPNIATVLDAGSTASGRPYFVMELVAGQPLDEFCDSRRLSIPDRLALFLQVCRAVQHAHQKGIVHRDLKPSNVLVAIDDAGEPAVPKVIDFGIAKAIHQPASLSVTGDLRSLVGTPEYMSPEQVAGGQDIDTRTDIYALGGVLYKLLTGVTALNSDVTSRWSFDEVCRAIRDLQPVPPSKRLIDLCSEAFAAKRSEPQRLCEDREVAIANQRATTVTALRRMLRGELDWIVMKALEKDRSRRYESVSELAADIERYLNQEPILAGPPDAAYRMAKFVRRNRVAVVAALLVISAVIAGGAAATVGFIRADEHARNAERQREAAEIAHSDAVRQRGVADTRRLEAERERQQAVFERARAITESDKAARVVGLLEELVGAAHPDQGHPADFTVRQLLDEFAQSKLESLSEQPDVEASLRRTLGRAYWQLGDMPRAGPQLERALELRRAIYPAGDLRIVDSQVDLARYLAYLSRFDEALQLIQPAIDSVSSSEPTDAHVWAFCILGRIYSLRGRHADAEDCFQQSIKFAERVYGPRGLTTLWLQSLLVYSAGQRRDLDRAESLGRQILAEQTEILGNDHSIVARTKCWLALALLERNSKAQEADRLLRQAIEVHRKQLGAESSQVVHELVLLSDAQRKLRRPAEAERFAREAIESAERVTADGDAVRVRAYWSLAMVLRGKAPAAAAENFQKAIECQRGIKVNRPVLADLLFRRAASLREIGQASQAIDCLQEALDISREPSDAEWVGLEIGTEVILYYMACTQRQLGDLPAADRLLHEAIVECDPARIERPLAWFDWIDLLLEIRDSAGAGESAKWLDRAADAARQLDEFHKESPSTINRVGAILGNAAVYMARGDLDSAESLVQSGLDLARKASITRAFGRGECLRADVLILQRRFDDAEILLLALDRAARAQNPFQVDDVLFVTRRLVKLYEAWGKPEDAGRWRSRLPGRQS